ncbi:hypothetical protein PsorP6_004383 [Peronosclerospora sorghi]|uniref:Uncharacterized protein n=1 Tax=Peronosclerospora sorghi TaxID=230839 RepID=A0ACC0VL03_9STRA|nr:hypothetical protein PsorP6_004383 [Peronosclerospora sorghi]
MELVAGGVRRTADPTASSDAVRAADDERLIEEPGLPVQAGRNVSRNSGRPSRKGTPQSKNVTTTTPAAPRQRGLTSTPTLKNDATFTSNAARTRNRIGHAEPHWARGGGYHRFCQATVQCGRGHGHQPGGDVGGGNERADDSPRGGGEA